MPSRNVIKIDVPESYYHVYARGASRKEIFLDDSDYQYFLSMFARYLSVEQQRDRTGRSYVHLTESLELLAYCLMSNHFHLMFYQIDEGAISAIMRGVMTSYSRYFNHKYDRSGPLFETRYKSSLISSDAYLMHISRYIHLNPRDWRVWQWSSYGAYANRRYPEWLKADRVEMLFSSKAEYLKFIEDYDDEQRMRDQIKHELADS